MILNRLGPNLRDKTLCIVPNLHVCWTSQWKKTGVSLYFSSSGSSQRRRLCCSFVPDLYFSSDPLSVRARQSPITASAYICNYREHWFTIRQGFQLILSLLGSVAKPKLFIFGSDSGSTLVHNFGSGFSSRSRVGSTGSATLLLWVWSPMITYFRETQK